MPTKIRLQRRGKKGQPFYHIVVADGRAPRDGKFIESIGSYNPITDPASIALDIDKALTWLQNGAQPTDTVRSILKNQGVLYKKHLYTGVRKGALTKEQADAKFASWLNEKLNSQREAIKQKDLSSKEEQKKRISAEAKVKEAKEKAIIEKQAKKAAEAAEKANSAEAETN